jgi:hypothetical protein
VVRQPALAPRAGTLRRRRPASPPIAAVAGPLPTACRSMTRALEPENTVQSSTASLSRRPGPSALAAWVGGRAAASALGPGLRRGTGLPSRPTRLGTARQCLERRVRHHWCSVRFAPPTILPPGSCVCPYAD